MRRPENKFLHKIKVAHITSAHHPLDVRIFHKECRSLACAGYDVVELTTAPQDTHRSGVRIVGIGNSRGRLHRMTFKMLQMMRAAFRLRADVYHLHDPELLPLGILLRLCGKCVIYDVHEDLPRDVLHKKYIPSRLRRPFMHVIEWMETAAARRMSGLVAATPSIAGRFQPANANTVAVSNFPLLSEFVASRPPEWRRRKQAVAYVGGITEERGIAQTLSAMDLLSESGVRLELAGWFPDPALHRQLSGTAAWRNVDWHGLLGRQEIAELLNSVRAGLVILHPQPNFMDSQPVKLFEYMAAGIPVIASDFPLWRGIIDSVRCGILVDPYDPAAIANAINYLLTHDEEAEEMGRRGRLAVEQRFNWKIEEQKLLGLYHALTSLHPQAAPVDVTC
jgi:glycosyltransferase involved in cell wall biosynthesis